MKKLLAFALSLAMVLSMAACGSNTPTTEAPTEAPTTVAPTEAPTTEAPTTEAPTTEAPTTEAPKPQAMSYEEFMAADLETEVTVMGTIQLAAYNEEYKNANLFLADEDGAYFVYRMAVEEGDESMMKPGTVLLVTGFKAEWSGEIEITEAKYERLPDEPAVFPEAKNVTALDPEEMAELMNRRVLFSNGTVAASENEEGELLPFLYQWNGSGEEGDDIYFKVDFGGHLSYTFVVESDEFPADSSLYKAVQELQIGDMLDVEAFLYWYEGPQPHVCDLKDPSAGAKSEGVMSYEEYVEADVDADVCIEGYIQQFAYNSEEGYVNLFLEDLDGGYYIYRMNMEAADAAELALGRKIKVTGKKAVWAGEVEVSDGSYEFQPGCYISDALNITYYLNRPEDLEGIMNCRIAIKSAVVAASKDADEKDAPFLYKWNGSGVEGDDLYFTVSVLGEDYVLTVESDEHPAGSEVYEAVKALNIGDSIDLEGFLYWYEGPQPHIYLVSEAAVPETQTTGFLEFLMLDVDSEVLVDAYVQQVAYNEEHGNASLFLASPDGGAFYVYRMEVTEEEAAQLKEGAHVLVKGYKTEWSGLLEITEASFELLEGEYISQPTDVSVALDQDVLLAFLMSDRISVKAAIVMGSTDAEENLQPFLYKWNGSGEEGDDIYINLLVSGGQYTFVVESDEFGADSDLYKAVQALEIGDVIDVEAFLYWYEGPQPHIYGAHSEAYVKQSEEALSFGQYLTADMDTEVTVEGFVQLTTSYWEKDGQGLISLFLHDKAGGYYVYNLPVTEEEAESLTPGTLVRIKGFKTEWSELPEIGDASFEILESEEKYMAEATPAIFLFDEEAAERASFFIASPIYAEGVVVEPSVNEAGEEQPFLYKWNGSGQEGDDIYFNVSYAGQTVTLVVESDEFDKESEVYQAVQALKIGDVIDFEAFLYWYNGPQPHVTMVDGSAYTKVDGALSHREYLAAEMEEKVTIDAYVQQAAFVQKDEDLLVNLFLSDRVGGYYVYGMKLDDIEEFFDINLGVRLTITGYKTEWSGEVEITDVEDWAFVGEPGEDSFVASALDMSEKIGDEEAVQAMMNLPFILRNAEVIASQDADDKDVPFLYKWNGSGEEGDDIYFKVKVGETELTIVVETDELPAEGLEYQFVQSLKVGDHVDLRAFMYFYEGPQPHLADIQMSEAEGE